MRNIWTVHAQLALLLGMALALPSGCSCANESTSRPPGGSDTSAAPAEVSAAAQTNASETMLISVAKLENQLDDSMLRILDIRSADEYANGHIPGSVSLDMRPWMEKSLSPEGLLDAEYWSEQVGKLGISNDHRVVICYDSLTNAARVWWTLRYLGLKEVALLEGGWNVWAARELPTKKKQTKVEQASFEPRFQADRLAGHDELKRAVADKGLDWVVVDARSKDEYTGRDKRGERGGHIPGAVHLEWSELLDVAGYFKTPEQLSSLFDVKGVDAGQTVVTHCQSGGRASVEAFALELAGFPRVKNYYEGWQRWSADQEAPVEEFEEDE